MDANYQLQQRIAELQAIIEDRDDQIHQLRIEVEGAAEAVNAINHAQPPIIQPVIQQIQQNDLPTRTESILKTLQTPQIIRDIACFDGNPIKLNSFIKTIDNLMPLLRQGEGTPVFTVWMQAIRSKIIGDADSVLELYGTEPNWNDIKSTLTTHFSDKRDETSLTRDLFKLTQTNTVEEFYGSVSHSISLLVNLLNLNEQNNAVIMAKKTLYQELGLKVFLSGLKEPLGPIIRAQTPRNLKDALRLCLEENNYNYVKNPFRTAPQIPPKPQFSQPKPITIPYPKPFQFPQPSHYHSFQPKTFQPYQARPLQAPQMRQQQFFQQNPFQHPQRNPFQFNQPKPFQFTQSAPRNFQPNPFTRNAFAPKPINPQPKPVPMEVDQSIRTKQINYMNRNFHPNYQLEEYDPNTFFDPNMAEQPFYIPEQYPYYMNPQQENTEEEPNDSNSQTTTVEKEKETDKTNTIDDLNFQVAGYSDQIT